MLSLLLMFLLLQQSPDKGIVEGRVFDAETGAPLKSARVRLSGGSDYDRVVSTDEKGLFVIPDVEPGSYNVRADQNGYLGQRGRAPGSNPLQNFSVKAGGRYPFEFALPLGASLSGRLLDDNRQPITGGQIQLLSIGYDNLGNRSFGMGTVNFGTYLYVGPPTFTRKQGEFEFASVPPGDYYLRYSSNVSSTYYPGVARADDAIPIRLSAGSDVKGLDFSPVSVKTFNVSGKFTNPFVRGEVTDYEFALVPRDTIFRDAIASIAHPEPGNDLFKLENVPPGSYDLYITYRDYVASSNGVPYVGRAVVDVVDHDVTDLRVEIRKGLEVTFEIVLDESAAALKPQGFPIPRLAPADGLPVGAQPLGINLPRDLSSMSSAITLSNVARGRYILNFSPGPNLFVSAVRFGTRDILGQPFDIDDDATGPLTIELSASGSAMEGVVTTRDGVRAADAQIWLVPPINRRQDRSAYLAAQTDAQGRFRFTTIAPGTYTAFAFSSSRNAMPAGAIMNAEYMTPYLNSGVSVELPRGQTIRQDLTAVPVRR
jgi:hypothetical protein